MAGPATGVAEGGLVTGDDSEVRAVLGQVEDGPAMLQDLSGGAAEARSSATHGGYCRSVPEKRTVVVELETYNEALNIHLAI